MALSLIKMTTACELVSGVSFYSPKGGICGASYREFVALDGAYDLVEGRDELHELAVVESIPIHYGTIVEALNTH